MSELATYQRNLPDTIGDLSRFVLVGREKLTSVRAEIRAIDKVQLAQEVRDQKMEEARMLSEALLDAEVKLGDMTKLIPKSVGGRPEKTNDSAVGSFKQERFKNDSGVAFDNPNQMEWKNDSAVDNPKPKKEIISDLGFTTKQVERFEKLADNKDLVEEVKAKARENDDIPTRTQVLSLADERAKLFQRQRDQVDVDCKAAQAISTALQRVFVIEITDSSVIAAFNGRGNHLDGKCVLQDIRAAIEHLETLYAKYSNCERREKNGTK